MWCVCVYMCWGGCRLCLLLCCPWMSLLLLLCCPRLFLLLSPPLFSVQHAELWYILELRTLKVFHHLLLFSSGGGGVGLKVHPTVWYVPPLPPTVYWYSYHRNAEERNDLLKAVSTAFAHSLWTRFKFYSGKKFFGSTAWNGLSEIHFRIAKRPSAE